MAVSDINSDLLNGMDPLDDDNNGAASDPNIGSSPQEFTDNVDILKTALNQSIKDSADYQSQLAKSQNTARKCRM